MKLAMLISIGLIISNYCNACQCPEPYKERFKTDSKNATAIFYGKVIETNESGQWAKIVIIRIYKNNGYLKDTLEIGERNLISSCASRFNKGELTLVYSYSSSSTITSSLCSSTISLKKETPSLTRQRRKLKKIYKTS